MNAEMEKIIKLGSYSSDTNPQYEEFMERDKEEKKYYEEKRKEEKILNSRIDRYFIDNQFKVEHEKLIKYYENLDWIKKGISIYLFGNHGTHKTSQITTIMLKALDNNYKVRYYRSSEIVYQKDYEKIKECDILCLDNFGASAQFEQSRGALFDLLDYRIHNYKSTIIITNENNTNKFDPALVDRFKMYHIINCDGKSDRKKMEVASGSVKS